MIPVMGGAISGWDRKTPVAYNSLGSAFSFGNCLHHDGANSHDKTAFTGLTANATKWTWMVWFKQDTIGSLQVLFSYYNSASYRRILSVNSSNQIELQIRNGVNAFQRSATNTIEANKWYCMFVVFYGAGAANADKVKCFLGEVGTDANLVDLSLTFSLATPTSLNGADGASAIYWGSSFATGNYQNGYQDQRAMWNTNLTYEQCDAMYNGGLGADPLLTNCVYWQKLNEDGTTTTAVEEIAGLNTTLINVDFDANSGWALHAA